MDLNGYFDGSDDAAGYVELRIPGLAGRHLLSQFIGTLKRTGIAAEVMAGAAPKTVPILTAPPVLRVTNSRIDAYSEVGLSYVQLYGDGRLIRRFDDLGHTFSFSILEGGCLTIPPYPPSQLTPQAWPALRSSCARAGGERRSAASFSCSRSASISIHS